MVPGDDDEALAAEWDSALDESADGGADDLAAEWEAMMTTDGEGEDGVAGAGRESTRVLNQDEIDSLLGFDEDGDDAGERAGIQSILSSALVSYERLPMLEVVFDRLVRLMSTCCVTLPPITSKSPSTTSPRSASAITSTRSRCRRC